MPLSLGPMPDGLRPIVSRHIAEHRRRWRRSELLRRLGLGWLEKYRRKEPSRYFNELNAIFIVGGPSGCTYLDADGEIWDRSAWDDSIVRVEDGPGKVGIIAFAARSLPELAQWLPRRPAGAVDCSPC